MHLYDEIKLTIDKALDCKNLFFLFVVISLPLALISFLKNYSAPLAVLLFMFMMPLVIFIEAGFHGIIFLKINDKAIDTKTFFKLGAKNFWSFVKVAICIAIVGGILNWSLTKLLITPEENPTNVMSYYYAINIFIGLFFVFSLPIVILEYFSQKKLKPIKNSVLFVIQNASQIKLIFIIMLIQLIVSLVHNSIIGGDPMKDNTSFFISFINWPLRFILIIYTFSKLINCFYSELEFNFKRHIN